MDNNQKQQNDAMKRQYEIMRQRGMRDFNFKPMNFGVKKNISPMPPPFKKQSGCASGRCGRPPIEPENNNTD